MLHLDPSTAPGALDTALHLWPVAGPFFAALMALRLNRKGH
jgi:hypothetical protein